MTSSFFEDSASEAGAAFDANEVAGGTCVFPASFAQERLWFLDQLEPGSFVYNLPSALRLRGKVHFSALRRSIAELVRRHETLRTSFVTINGRPFQSIVPQLVLPFPLIDVSALQHVEPGAAMRQIIRDEGRRPFDLARGPLIRTTLLRLHAEEHILLLTLHHSIADAWSLTLCFDELNQLYAAFASGKSSPLEELPLQYADYATWQREWLQGEVLERELTYWKERLAGIPAMLELPSDHPRPSVQTYQGARYYFRLPASLTNALETLSRAKGATLFMTLLAAFQVLLSRLAGQQDIVVGTPIAGRTQVELEGLIGLFVNTLVLRGDLSTDPPFDGLLEQVRERALEAFEHQDLPFDRVVDALRPQRSLRTHPLFQVLFTFQNVPPASSESSPAALLPVYTDMEVETAKCDLSLVFWREEEELGGALDYNTDLFEPATIARWAMHLQVLLAAIVADPGQRISTLAILSEQEQRKLVEDWNPPDEEYPVEDSLLTLFEQQVAHIPEAIALICEEQQLSYQELDARAASLACHLQRLGVGPDDLVGVCLPRSLPLVIALLAVLKTGGAYVPLDPGYPGERLAFQLADARVGIVLTDQQARPRLPQVGVQVLEMEQVGRQVEQERAALAKREVQPDTLAYVIYTSGSTGRPKGVMVTHRGLTNYLRWAVQAYAVIQGHGSLLHSSLAFDLSVTALFTPLLVGQRVRLLPEERDLDALAQALREERHLSLVKLTPTHLSALAQRLEGTDIAEATSALLLGGEALLPEHVAFWRQAAPGTRLVNEYGPTETVVGCCIYDLPGGEARIDRGPVPIGRPIANTQLYILDRHLRPVPSGVSGELYIGGAGVARGYLGRPDVTAERFVPHPFSRLPGARLYKTGDLARYLPDGTIEYLGRNDQQVKLRGYRIELGEIEAALVGHPQVRAAAVLLREIAQGDRRLVAYIAPEPGQAPASSDLRAYLLERLPEFMVPATFVQLETLPVTSNGKLDRGALPVPEWGQATAQAFVAPRTLNEEILAGIWARVLRVERVGINTNFFEAGGDSILSLLTIAQAREAGLVLTPKQIFQYQTIAELARVAVAATPAGHEQAEAGGLIPLTPIQHWFFEQNLPDAHHWNQAMLLEVAHPLITRQLVVRALASLLGQHGALSLRFKRAAGTWEQYGVEQGAAVEELVRAVDLSSVPAAERERSLLEECALAQASLHLTDGPLLRFVYFTLGEQPGRLLIVIHHLLVDGVSWRILLEDLRTVCQQLLNNEPIQLPQKTTSFSVWAERLQDYARSAEVQREAAYWLAEERHSVPALPMDFAGDLAANREATTSSVNTGLTVEETDALLHRAAGAYHTRIHELLLTALVLACAPWTGKRSLLVDVEGHGREDVIEGIDLSRTVGWFTTLFPLLLNLQAVPATSGPGNAIKAIKEQVRGVPANGIGYGLLRYPGAESETRARLQTMPRAQISFNYLGQFGQSAQSAEPTLFRPALESSGPVRSLSGRRTHLLEVVALVERGVFHVEWTYSTRFHRSATIEALARRYLETLRALIDHCCAPEAGGYTPSDFSGVGLNQAKLDKFMAKIRSNKR